MASTATAGSSIYDRITRKVLSGELVPGTRLVERDLAAELGVSRIPVRETLAKLVAQGVLIGGEKGQGVWVREYSTDEVRQLYEFREAIEAGAARSAAESATSADIIRLEMICDEMDAIVGQYHCPRWAQLDHKFHEALAQAGRNERFIRALRTLLAECHYVFFLHPANASRPEPSQEQAETIMRTVARGHRELLELVRHGDAEAAGLRARADMRNSAERACRSLNSGDLRRGSD